MFRFQEERVPRESKLQAVFGKLSGVRPRAEDLGKSNNKIMTTDIIESVLTEASVPVQSLPLYPTPTEPDPATIAHLVHLLSEALREAKGRRRPLLHCQEVLLPCGLLERVASDMAAMAEAEPCGLRGCLLYLDLDEQRVGTVRCDPETVPTFELHLGFREERGGWMQMVPGFIRNLTVGGTIVLSPAYVLNKKKLYRTHPE